MTDSQRTPIYLTTADLAAALSSALASHYIVESRDLGSYRSHFVCACGVGWIVDGHSRSPQPTIRDHLSEVVIENLADVGTCGDTWTPSNLGAGDALQIALNVGRKLLDERHSAPREQAALELEAEARLRNERAVGTADVSLAYQADVLMEAARIVRGGAR